MAQQPWEAEQRLRVEGTEVTTYTSTQLNAEFRAIENDASENDEFCQIRMQEFAIQAEEATDSQNRSPCGFPPIPYLDRRSIFCDRSIFTHVPRRGKTIYHPQPSEHNFRSERATEHINIFLFGQLADVILVFACIHCHTPGLISRHCYESQYV